MPLAFGDLSRMLFGVVPSSIVLDNLCLFACASKEALADCVGVSEGVGGPPSSRARWRGFEESNMLLGLLEMDVVSLGKSEFEKDMVRISLSNSCRR